MSRFLVFEGIHYDDTTDTVEVGVTTAWYNVFSLSCQPSPRQLTIRSLIISCVVME